MRVSGTATGVLSAHRRQRILENQALASCAKMYLTGKASLGQITQSIKIALDSCLATHR